MGAVLGQVTFHGQAPDQPCIAEKISELSGLPVSVEPSGADVRGDLYEGYAHLAFDCASEDKLTLYTYRPGTV
jgi:hypothetical protein